MRIGTLDNRVQLQHRTLTPNARGEQVQSYTTYATVWARRNDVRGREFFAAQQINFEGTTEFTIRYRTDVLITDRIVEGSKTYNIRHIAEFPRNKGLSLIATTVQL